jgi:biopolymer transport protein ExbD
MPVKLGPKHSSESDARIEIIPLIDIMFFLLASFMLVSLSMVNLKSIKVNLPTATTATIETKNDFASISVDKAGAVYLDKQPVGANELVLRLNAWHHTNENLRVFISGDQDVRYGAVVHVLDLVRSTGIQKVGVEIRDLTPTQP